MLLLTNETKAIATILCGLDHPSLVRFLGYAGLPSISIFSSPNVPLPVIALQFTEWLAKHEGMIVTTLDALLGDFPHHSDCPVLRSARERIGRDIAATSADFPWHDALIAGVPMVNRSRLRSVLASLIQGALSAPPVVMVDGLPGTGRSHSYYLIHHVAKRANVNVAKVDVNGPVLELQTLDYICRLLVKKLGLGSFDAPSAVGATPETVAVRYAEEVCIAWNNRTGSGPTWIVFDSLDRPVAPEIKSFICALAAKRLSHEMDDCTFFLLGAGTNYGISDPSRRIELERISVFLIAEIEQAANALNALGRTQLDASVLALRLQEMRSLLESGETPGDICAAVAAKLVDLRLEASA